MTPARLLVGGGIAVLALWGASLAVEEGASQAAPSNGDLVAMAAMPVPTLAPLRPLHLPKRDIFAADVPSASSAAASLGEGGKSIGSVVVPDVGGPGAAASTLTLLATGVDLDTNAGYALIEDNDGGRIVHVGDAIGAGATTVVNIRPRALELSDGTAVVMATASRAGVGEPLGASGVPIASGRSAGGGYYGPAPTEISPPAPQPTAAVPGIPLNGTVDSITVNPGLNVGSNPGGFSSATGIPSGTLPASLSGALGSALPGASTTGLGTGNTYQGMDPFAVPSSNAPPGTVNPGAVR